MELQTAPAPPPVVTGHAKQYVFVDEYNRHKRLKVMRACDGCRKRKIKCDGAVQNGPWPCGACLRLKLKCVPPTLDPDDDQHTPDSANEPGQFTFQTTSVVPPESRPNGMPPQQQMVREWAAGVAAPPTTMLPVSSPMPQDIAYSTQPFHRPPVGARVDSTYTTDEYFAPATGGLQFHSGYPAPSFPRSQTDASGSSSGDPQEVDATVRELAHQMGDLAIHTSTAAPWIANEKKNLAETPAVEEVEVILPLSVSTDSTVRIPPEMMPSDERAMDYFGYFFDYVHPYVPVLNRAAFYDQWRSARHSISPLILEGIFACVARYLEEPIEVRRWMALASRHEDSFKDVPRLSTIQGMMLLAKAREFVPKRGYYYRSWMAVKYMSTMAIDLSMHEHYDQHRNGNSCPLSKTDCLMRVRIWQSIFILELLLAAPQGRTDFAVELDTVDFSIPTATTEVDTFEYQTSKRYAYMAQTFRNIKHSNMLFQSMKRVKKDWALDPKFVARNEENILWIDRLPSEAQLEYPDDGSPPWLRGDHFITYVHIYQHLVVIMHHRPQLQTLLEMGDQTFTEPLEVCLQSASRMCRIQEALIRDFGLHGLQWMQRGIGFTIYCILTCTMLHLAAITSPDPIQNADARTYFTRHMRVLEHCIPGATPEMQLQINALREAFSQDTSKPFELKPTLGLRSPSTDNMPTPPEFRGSPNAAPVSAHPTWSHLTDAASSATVSPASEYGSSFDPVSGHGVPGAAALSYPSAGFPVSGATSFAPQVLHQQATSAPQHTGYALAPVLSHDQLPAAAAHAWDPSGIFSQWNAAFGGAPPPPGPAPQTPALPDPRMHPTSAPLVPQQPSPTSQQAMYGSPTQSNGSAPGPPSLVGPVHTVPSVTPVMWQDALTNAYISGHGQKRYREASVDHSAYAQYAKRRG